MQYANANDRKYTLIKAKGNTLPNWCEKIEKPAKVRMDGTFVTVYHNPEKSDYIYFKLGNQVYCVWAKDPKDFDFVKETALKLFEKPKKEKAQKPAKEAKPKTNKAKAPAAKKANGKKPAAPAAEKAKAAKAGNGERTVEAIEESA